MIPAAVAALRETLVEEEVQREDQVEDLIEISGIQIQDLRIHGLRPMVAEDPPVRRLAPQGAEMVDRHTFHRKV